jgi:hypothetical protein
VNFKKEKEEMAKTGAVIKKKVITLEVETSESNQQIKAFFRDNSMMFNFNVKQIQVNNIEAKK